MKILHMYTPGDREEDQAATWEALKSIREHYTVEDLETVDPDDYENLLIARWGTDDLIVVEQDLVPTLDAIDRLARCKHPVCANAYRIYPATEDAVLIPFVVDGPGNRRQIIPGESWAHQAGLGLTKISTRAQKTINPDAIRATSPSLRWNGLDMRLSAAVVAAGMRYHVHWPLAIHNHLGPFQLYSNPVPPTPVAVTEDALCRTCIYVNGGCCPLLANIPGDGPHAVGWCSGYEATR